MVSAACCAGEEYLGAVRGIALPGYPIRRQPSPLLGPDHPAAFRGPVCERPAFGPSNCVRTPLPERVSKSANPQRIAESKGNLSGEGLFFAKDLSLRVDTVVEVL